MGKTETPWDRIDSDASLNLIIDAGIDDRQFVDDWLEQYSDSLEASHFVPVRFSCKDFSDSMPFWNSLFSQVLEQCMPFYTETELSSVLRKKKNALRASEPDQVYMCLEGILTSMKRSGYNVLLILEDFEAIFGVLPLPEVNQFREMADCCVLVTVSPEDPDTLGGRYYESTYFCNKFVIFDFRTVNRG